MMFQLSWILIVFLLRSLCLSSILIRDCISKLAHIKKESYKGNLWPSRISTVSPFFLLSLCFPFTFQLLSRYFPCTFPLFIRWYCSILWRCIVLNGFPCFLIIFVVYWSCSCIFIVLHCFMFFLDGFVLV